jgi:hypothetical protein
MVCTGKFFVPVGRRRRGGATEITACDWPSTSNALNDHLQQSTKLQQHCKLSDYPAETHHFFRYI